MRILYLLLTLIILISCKSEPKPIKVLEPKTELQKIEKKKKVEKPIKEKVIELDTINNKNTVAFLRAYGKENPETDVLIETSMGNIKIRLYKDTPLHRASFIFLTKTGYFSTTCFHRVIKDFIVQGGNSDHPQTRKLRMKYKSYTIPAEMKSYRKHDYGSLAAAREWDNNPDKVSSPFEFYIIQQKGGSHHLDGEHTIFGKVISGMSVVNKICQLETDNKEWPIKDVYITAKVIK